MWKDPIIEEIHQVREKLWRESGENLDAYLNHLKGIEEQYKDRLVKPEELSSIRRKKEMAKNEPAG